MPLPFNVSLPRSGSIERLRTAMVRQRLSQRELAGRCDLPREQLARILAGKVPFPRHPQLLQRLAEALGLDPADFPEYRERLPVLPEASRRLLAHLEATGMSVEAFKQNVTRLHDDQLRLILSGGAPFPTDPRIIEDLAKAAGASPFLFNEYLPLDRLADRLEAAAKLALDPAAAAAFCLSLERMATHLERLPVASLDAQVLSRMRSGASQDPLGNLRAFLPRWEDLQPIVREVLDGLEARNWQLDELAGRAQVDPDELLAYLKGQLRLKDEALIGRLRAALEEGSHGQDPAGG